MHTCVDAHNLLSSRITPAIGVDAEEVVHKVVVASSRYCPPGYLKHVDDLCVALLGRRRYSTALIPSFVYPPILVLTVSNPSLDWRGATMDAVMIANGGYLTQLRAATSEARLQQAC